MLLLLKSWLLHVTISAIVIYTSEILSLLMNTIIHVIGNMLFVTLNHEKLNEV